MARFFSIIIPMFNSEQFVEETLQSLEARVTAARTARINDFRGDLDTIGVSILTAAYGFPLLLLLLAGLQWLGVSRLFRQLGGEPAEVVNVSRRVANGELVLPESQSKKEASSAMGALIETVHKLVEVITEIRASADSVDESARIIDAQNRELNQRTLGQAASLEKTSASMEEMTATVKQNAENAFAANELTLGARRRAEQGGEVVAEVVAAMSEINVSSQKIGDITSVIDEIAFQTNLLALNAAVEAARAGDQGRGFAVVANEVRNLAQRSAEAAKEIKVLIEDSVSKVESGSNLVNEAGDTLTELIESVQQVSSLMAAMATANEEQTQGIEQVNRAINQMEHETQQNTALVQKASEASKSMMGQAYALREGVAFFKLGMDLDTSGKTPATVPPLEESADDFSHWKGEERRSKVRPWSGDDTQEPLPKRQRKLDSGKTRDSF